MSSGGNDTTTRGREAEALAARYLERRGVRVLQRNFRIRGGEIDLICQDGPILVFVEVRLRTHQGFGGASASVTAAKRRRLVLAARYFLACRPQTETRFDCVFLSGLDERDVEWIPGAFTADP